MVDPGWPLHDLRPQQCIILWSRILPPNLVAIGHSFTIWPLVDPGWPLHDFRPQQCTTFWSGVLPTKFGAHREFLSNLTPSWRRLTPAWPSTTAMHYSSDKGSFYQTWCPLGVPEQFDSWLIPAWPLTPAMLYSSVSGSSYQIWCHRAFLKHP